MASPAGSARQSVGPQAVAIESPCKDLQDHTQTHDRGLKVNRVFVVSESVKERYCLDGIRRYGDIVFLYDENERKPSIYNTSQFAASLATRLSDHAFDASNDFVAMVGRQIEVGILFYVLGLLVGDVKIIFFDAAKAEYSESELRKHAVPDFTAP